MEAKRDVAVEARRYQREIWVQLELGLVGDIYHRSATLGIQRKGDFRRMILFLISSELPFTPIYLDGIAI